MNLPPSTLSVLIELPTRTEAAYVADVLDDTAADLESVDLSGDPDAMTNQASDVAKLRALADSIREQVGA